MSLNDLVSDYVARVNNGITAKKESISVLKSKMIIEICKKLVKLDYLQSFEENGFEVDVVLNLDKLSSIKRISKPGHRVYSSHESFPKVVGGLGYTIITTSKGILTQVEANKQNLGGEVLFQIY